MTNKDARELALEWIKFLYQLTDTSNYPEDVSSLTYHDAMEVLQENLMDMEHEYRTALTQPDNEEITRLKARLEIQPDTPYGGINTRDETIRLLEKRLSEKPSNEGKKWHSITEEMTILQMVNRMPLKFVKYIGELEQKAKTQKELLHDAAVCIHTYTINYPYPDGQKDYRKILVEKLKELEGRDA